MKIIIPGVIYREMNPAWSNKDERREMFGIINGEPDLVGYTFVQFKRMQYKMGLAL